MWDMFNFLIGGVARSKILVRLKGGTFFAPIFFFSYLGDLRKRPLLVNLKYWVGSSLTGLTVSDAPV